MIVFYGLIAMMGFALILGAIIDDWLPVEESEFTDAGTPTGEP
jgi:hypothetical protein